MDPGMFRPIDQPLGAPYEQFATADGDPAKLPQIDTENYLKAADALDNGSYWAYDDVTVTEPSTGIFRLTKTAAGGYQDISQVMTNWFPPSAGRISVYFEARSGTLNALNASLRFNGSSSVDEVEIVSGNATVDISGDQLRTLDLDGSWTKFRASATVKGWSTSVELFIYPDGAGSNLGYLDVRNVQVVLGDQAKPRPVGAGLDDWMGAYKPHNRLFGDGLGRYAVVDGTVNAEILLNPGFETAGGGGADIWADHQENAGDGALANETGIKHGGSDSAKMTTGASANTYTNMSRATTPGAPYTVRGWNYGDGSNAGRYAVWDDDNAGWIIDKTSSGQTAAAWAEVVDHFTAPAGCESVTVYWYGPSANGGVCYWDDVSLRAQNTSGLVSCGECSDILLDSNSAVAFDCPADCRISLGVTFEAAKYALLWPRYTDSNNTVKFGFNSSSRLYLENVVGGDTEAAYLGPEVADHEYFRSVLELFGSDWYLYLDDAMVDSGTFSSAGNNATTGGQTVHNLVTTDMKVTTETYPQRSVGIIMAGGLAAPAYGDPGVWITESDGSAFDVGASDAVMFTVKTFVAAKESVLGFDSGTTGNLNLPRFRLNNNQLFIRTAAAFETPQAWVAGQTKTFMQLLRSDTHGSQFPLHDSGKSWKRFNVNEDAIPAAAAFPAIANYNAALYVTAFALLDLSSVHEAEWVDQLDNVAVPSDNVKASFDARTGALSVEVDITRPNPITGHNLVRLLNASDAGLFYIGSSSGNETLRVYSSTAADNVISVGSALPAGATTNVKLTVEADGATRVFVANVLVGTVTLPAADITAIAKIESDLGGVGETQADRILTPHPALGGSLGATDRVVAPQDADTATHDAAFMSIFRNIDLSTTADLRHHVTDSDNRHRIRIYDTETFLWQKEIATAVTELINQASAVGAGKDAMAVLDGADAEGFADGASVGSSANAAGVPLTGTFEIIAGGGTMDAAEFWSRYVNMPFKIKT
jgi:hypothetical protein